MHFLFIGNLNRFNEIRGRTIRMKKDIDELAKKNQTNISRLNDRIQGKTYM